MTTTSASPAVPPSPIHVLFCCDPGYYQHLAVAAVSLLENNQAAVLDLHLITSRRDLEAETRLARSIARYANFSFHIHTFSSAATERWHTSFHITGEAYTRLFAASVLDPAIDKILYLDADLVVIDDLAPLWETDVANHALAAAPDPYGAWRKQALGMPEAATYVNSGVMLLNLARWRRDGLTARLARYIESAGPLLFHDQDAVNAVLHDAVRVLGYRWNLQARMLRGAARSRLSDGRAIAAAARAPAIVHYTSARKPWLFVMAVPAKLVYREYLKKTDWRDAPPVGRSWTRLLEYAFNHLAYHAGLEMTWDRMLRSTSVGRVIDRSLRLFAPPVLPRLK
jgi:lipopolysaccharide biosynthesis glycosyltransferase